MPFKYGALPVSNINTLICGLTLACLNLIIKAFIFNMSSSTQVLENNHTCTKSSLGLPTRRGHLSAVNWPNISWSTLDNMSATFHTKAET